MITLNDSKAHFSLQAVETEKALTGLIGSTKQKLQNLEVNRRAPTTPKVIIPRC